MDSTNLPSPFIASVSKSISSKPPSSNFCSKFSSHCDPIASSNCLSYCNDDFRSNEIASTSIFHSSPAVHLSTAPNSYTTLGMHNSAPISSSKYALWHTRLGHPHHHALLEVLKLCQIPIPQKPPTDLCFACCLGKSHRLPSTLSNTTFTCPFELVVCDLWGPAPMVSSGGYSYFLTCVDAFSRFVWVFPLKLKSDTLTQFIHFKSMVELQFNCKIKGIQSDGGGEFKPLTKFLAPLGITHRFSCPYTHHQNGIVERKHCHIVETGLALLAHSKLPFKYWDHSFVTAAYLINRLPSASLQNKSPYSILMNKSLDYSSLRAFGCSCFPFLRPYTSHKLSFRSQKCIFLGYSSVHKGYKCLSADGHIYISKDVQFHEARFPYPELFPSSSTLVTSTTSASWFPSASPPIPTFNIPPLQHVSPTASSQPSSSTAESHIAENPPSSIPTQPISPIVSNAGSPSSPMHHSLLLLPCIILHSLIWLRPAPFPLPQTLLTLLLPLMLSLFLPFILSTFILC